MSSADSGWPLAVITAMGDWLQEGLLGFLWFRYQEMRNNIRRRAQSGPANGSKSSPPQEARTKGSEVEPSGTTYRPQTFTEFIGNAVATRRVQIAIEAARTEHRMPPHILLHGNPGVGKTTLAQIVANALHAHVKTITGGMLHTEMDLWLLCYGLLEQQAKGREVVLIIDEIHGLANTATLPQEAWFPLLEDFLLYHSLKDKPVEMHERSCIIADSTIQLQTFTVIGMTTDPALLSVPLRDRFGLSIRLEEYTVEELSRIIHLHGLARVSKDLQPDVCRAIADRARGNPRVGINLLRECYDRSVVDHVVMDPQLIARHCELIGIRADGVTADDLKVLQALAHTEKGLSLASLAAMTGISVSTISEMVEPFLKDKGYLVITNRRKISETGKARLNQESEYSSG